MPGHGENNDNNFTTIKDCSKSIKEIVSKESFGQKSIIIGHSIGAQVVLEMLSSYPSLFKKGIVISGLNKAMPIVKKLVSPMIKLSMPLVKLKSFAKLQAKQFNLPDEMFNLYFSDSLKMSEHTLINILNENISFSFDAKNKTSVDTLLLVGAKEKKVMHESIHKTFKNLESARGYIVKHAGHGIPYEKSDLFNRVALKFLEGKKIEEEGLIAIK